MAGWISLHRSMQQHWLWEDKPFSKGQAWVDLILLASHKDKSFLFGGQLISVNRGSFVTSELKLMERWGWGRTKTRTFLKTLENESMIVKKTNNKNTVITIVKYEDFQSDEQQPIQQTNIKRTTDKHQTNTINKDNKENNDNKDIGTKVPCQQIADLYNQICISFPSCGTLSEARKKMINARLNTYSVEDIERAFTMAQDSDFLKGSNAKNWSANFDWMLKDANIAKILDGNYSNKDKQPPPKQPGKAKKNQFTDFEQRSYDVGELERKLLGGGVET